MAVFSRPKGATRRTEAQPPQAAEDTQQSGSQPGQRNARGWNAWKRDSQSTIEERAKKAAKGNGNMPMWKQRMRGKWSLRMEPMPNSDKKRLHPIEYEPVWVRFVERDDGIEGVGLPIGMAYFTNSKQRRVGVISNSMLQCTNQPAWRVGLPDLLEYKVVTSDSMESGKYLPHDFIGVKVVVVEEFHRELSTSGQYEAEYWHRCQGDRCVHCSSGDESVAEIIMGRGAHWILGLDRWNELLPFFRDAVQVCVECGDGEFRLDEFFCPSCDTTYVDSDTVDENGEAALDAGLRDYLIDNKVGCPHCKETVYMTPSGACVHVAGQGKYRRELQGCGNEESDDRASNMSLNPLLDYEFQLQVVPVKGPSGRRVAHYQVTGVRPVDRELPLDVPEEFYEEDSLLRLYGYQSVREQAWELELDVKALPFDLVELEDTLQAAVFGADDSRDSDSEER